MLKVLTNVANQSVDILAVRPLTLDVSKHACQNYDVDIISINCAVKRVIPNHASVQVAITRGVFFEICYAQSFHSKLIIIITFIISTCFKNK